MVSFSVVSLIAIVPDNECSTPTLMVSAAAAGISADPKNRDKVDNTINLYLRIEFSSVVAVQKVTKAIF